MTEIKDGGYWMVRISRGQHVILELLDRTGYLRLTFGSGGEMTGVYDEDRVLNVESVLDLESKGLVQITPFGLSITETGVDALHKIAAFH